MPRHHRHRRRGNRRRVSRSRAGRIKAPTLPEFINGWFKLAINSGEVFGAYTTAMFDRVTGRERRERGDSSGVPLESWRPKTLNIRAFRERYLKNIDNVNITRSGSLAQLPVEIQFEVFYYLDYRTLLALRQSCKYYRHFISSQMLEESKGRTREMFMQMERDLDFTGYQKPCYTCLHIKENAAFPDAAATQHYPNSSASPPISPLGTRYCIPCGVSGKKFTPGGEIKAGGRTVAICKHCKRFNNHPVNSNTVRSGWACPKCDEEVKFLQSTGVSIRFFQAVFAIVIFALVCAGNAVPRSSHMNSRMWRWVFQVSLDLFTIGACVNSWFFRNTVTKDQPASVRDDDYTFFLPIELLGLLGWTAAVVGLIYESTHPLYKHEFDRIAIALTVMSFGQVFFFIYTTLMSSSRFVRRCCVKNIQDEYP